MKSDKRRVLPEVLRCLVLHLIRMSRKVSSLKQAGKMGLIDHISVACYGEFSVSV